MSSWPSAQEAKVLGKRVTRLSGVDKVTGRAKYTYDIRLPGLLYGKILRCPYASAKILSVDTSKAEALPGVRAVVVVDENKTCRFVGDEVAAVAATSTDIAEDAIRLIEVEYDIGNYVVDEQTSMKPGAPKVHEDRENVRPGGVNEQGSIDDAFAEAAVTLEATYSTQVQTHMCLETHGHVVEWDGESMTVWASTQAVFGVRGSLADHFELPADQVRVITEHMGGGFGSKFGPGVEGVLAARLAKEAEAPVKLMLDRKEEFLAVGNRPSAIAEIRAAASKDGRLLAMDMKTYGTGGASGGAGFPLPYVYTVNNRRRQHSDVFINAGNARAMRAPGHPQASFIMESMMDELAYELGMDPLEFRRRNDPNEVRQGQYTVGAREIGWHRRNRNPREMKGTLRRGIGMGCGLWGGGGGKGTQARCTIHSDGTVEVVTGTQDLGTGIRTAIAIVAAEGLGLAPEQIHVRIGDSQPGLPSGGSGGSTTTASVTPVIKTAVDKARVQLLQWVAEEMEVEATALTVGDGKIFLADDLSRNLSWKEATSLLGTDMIVTEGEWDSNLRQSGVAGVQFAEVEVDLQTGQIQPIRIVAVQDCGLVVNRLTAESQVYSGVIQGLSWALLEDRIMDPSTGLMINPDMEYYKVTGSLDMPDIQVIMYDTHRKVTGLGEPPVIPTAGAIANAVFNATGLRFRSIPITPDKVLTAYKEANA